ncbi:hypothetical protein ACHAXA_011502 [Cyclostephanos tholiformis]|uniref:N-alpha-acetyltransferase 60 n=1 Tax=Cyclostephanos tholiformis TaxID=382380 RepID=A0ABD3SE49_9STRA
MRRDETASLLVPDPIAYPRMFYVMTLGTSREFRRCGLGSMLVEGIVDMIRGEKMGGDDGENNEDDDDAAGRWGRGLTGVLYLHVIVYNKGAMRLYERLGFVRVKRIKDYYLINSVSYDCYLYARYFHGNRGHQSRFDVLCDYAKSIIRNLGYYAIIKSTWTGK